MNGKISLWEFSKRVADLLLLVDGQIEWAKEEKVRRAWHLLFIAIVVALAIQFLLNLIISEATLGKSGRAAVTTPYRFYQVVMPVMLLCIFSYLMQQYYKTLLLTGKDLRLKSIIFFYSTTVLMFGAIYRALFYLQPTLFTYPNPVVTPEQSLQPLGLSRFAISADFCVYSASTMVFLTYPRISSASAVVSVINVVQALYALIILGLLVATFVEKTTETKQKRTRD